MNKQHYFFKLIPLRPTFPFDITSKEKQSMYEDGHYLQERFEAGEILLFGPVLAATGAFGCGGSKSIRRPRLGGLANVTRHGESRSKRVRDTPHASVRRPR